MQWSGVLEFVDSDTKDVFANAKISTVTSKKLSELTDEDWEGHEKFSSEEEMYKTYRTYYGDRVGQDTVVKLIRFIIK